MGRTLRGFEEEFPYIGSRGDTSDSGIVDKEEAYGAIGDHVVNEMFGGYQRIPISQAEGQSAPLGHVLGEDGQLLMANKPMGQVPAGPKVAANSLYSYVANTFGVRPSLPKNPAWGAGNTWVVSGAWGQGQEDYLDRVVTNIGQEHRTSAFKTKPKKGGSPVYVFTDSPFMAPTWARVYGLSVQKL